MSLEHLDQIVGDLVKCVVVDLRLRELVELRLHNTGDAHEAAEGLAVLLWLGHALADLALFGHERQKFHRVDLLGERLKHLH